MLIGDIYKSILKAKTMRVKACLRDLDRLHFQHISKRTARVKAMLDEAQRALLGGGSNAA